MKETWRWFGPADDISIAEIRQTGAQGIVSGLHHIPTGDVWSTDEITKRQRQVSHPDGTPSTLNWDVVESLPVSEDIKAQSGDYKRHFETYRQSLHNLADCGIKTVCYNFMPVLDWTRTALRRPVPNGGTTMYFDLTDFAAFDLFVLKRDGASDDYGAELIQEAQARHAQMTDADADQLAHNIVAGLPGANENWTLDALRAHLAIYAQMSADKLRAHLVDFLAEVVPTAESLGMRLCCHPDDPPFPLLGLPRVMSRQSDYAHVVDAVDSPANGITFCTGSLGVDPDFDPAGFIAALGHKIHFVHLRNTTRHAPADGQRSSFHEAEHLAGDTDMVVTIRALLAEEKMRRANGRHDHTIPMRPDHGQALTTDLDRPLMPGYPLVGRLRGLAELRGVMAAIGHADGA